jgi:hypothetical protein
MKDYVKNKTITITPNSSFIEFPKLLKGMKYISKDKDQIIIEVNTDIINTQEVLQFLTKKLDIDDIIIDNESLESVIRGIYEKI